jgi:hypothetical protein
MRGRKDWVLKNRSKRRGARTDKNRKSNTGKSVFGAGLMPGFGASKVVWELARVNCGDPDSFGGH